MNNAKVEWPQSSSHLCKLLYCHPSRKRAHDSTWPRLKKCFLKEKIKKKNRRKIEKLGHWNYLSVLKKMNVLIEKLKRL